jgi:hypothetical protein
MVVLTVLLIAPKPALVASAAGILSEVSANKKAALFGRPHEIHGQRSKEGGSLDLCRQTLSDVITAWSGCQYISTEFPEGLQRLVVQYLLEFRGCRLVVMRGALSCLRRNRIDSVRHDRIPER